MLLAGGTMISILMIMMIAWLFSASVAHAQTQGSVASTAPAVTHDADTGSLDRQASGAKVLSLFDKDIVKGLNHAWQRVAGGSMAVEAVVLIVRNADGSCQAVLPNPTHEYRQLTFRWQPGTIAIAHTHPNHSDPRPQPDDIEIAERFHVPMFTLTISGMFLYDPATKTISKVHNGVDWLDDAKWARISPVMASQLANK
jgi:hypothetical protein